MADFVLVDIPSQKGSMKKNKKPLMKSKKFIWKNRESDLAKVKRYFDPNHRFKVMYYRTNLSIHTQRLQLMTESLAKVAERHLPDFNPNLAVLITRFHDDVEMISKDGDVSLQQKLQHTAEQISMFKKTEMEEARVLDKMYYYRGNPRTIDGYPYLKLLEHSIYKDIPEAQLHSYVDKIDGFCEALHEVLAGNSVFLEPVMNYTFKFFSKREATFPLIKQIFASELELEHPFLKLPVIDLMDYFDNGKLVGTPHNINTIRKKVILPFYEEWRRLTLHYMPNGFELLTKQKEFL